MSYKHRGHFILTTFTLPRLRTIGTLAFLQAIRLEPYIRNLCQTAFLVILTIWQPHPHCHTQPVPLRIFPRLSALGCASHDFPELITPTVCIRLTLFGVLVNPLQGVTPSFEISVTQFSKTTPFIQLFVTLGYAFVGYSHRFKRRTCHTIGKLVHQEVNMNRQSAMVLMIGQPEQLLKQLSIEDRYQEVE